MGRISTEATIESLEDLWAQRRGQSRVDNVRRVVVPNALVDAGAVALSPPTQIIRQLGLAPAHGGHQVLEILCHTTN